MACNLENQVSALGVGAINRAIYEGIAILLFHLIVLDVSFSSCYFFTKVAELYTIGLLLLLLLLVLNFETFTHF